MNKPIVLQLRRKIFLGPETFIYNYISHLEKFHPLCFGLQYTNLDRFPLDSAKIFRPGPEHSFVDRSLYQGILKLTGFNYLPIRLLDKVPIRLMHAHFGPQGVAALRLKNRYRVPLCTTFYGYDVSQLARSSAWRQRYARLFKEGDLFLVEGQHMKNSLLNLGCPETKIAIQRIAIPLEKIAFKSRRPKGKNEKVKLIFAGRFYEKKGLLDALKAVDIVRQKNKNFQFDIIGSGPLGGRIAKFIADHGMGEDVHLHGFLPYSEYLRLLNEADIFIHPSITAKNGDSEGGAPTAILEAQAMGLPVISTTHADIPNIVVAGKSALLSPEGDYPGIAANIGTLLEDQSRWLEIGKAGREFVEKWHDIKREVVSLEKKYSRLLDLKQ
jgi:colanic acid/amylovoran biosynthesis glycosyltransferase